jgi:hypothetical protein
MAVNPEAKVCDDLDAELELANTLMASFCRVLESSKLPPMQVLQAMAKSLGGIYREVAAAHHRGDCQCGWCPDASGDVASMQKAIGAGLIRPRQTDLKSMVVVGRA